MNEPPRVTRGSPDRCPGHRPYWFGSGCRGGRSEPGATGQVIGVVGPTGAWRWDIKASGCQGSKQAKTVDYMRNLREEVITGSTRSSSEKVHRIFPLRETMP